MEALRQEWISLQSQFEQYEQRGLIIKLFAVVLVSLTLLVAHRPLSATALLLILWGQEAIFRTAQARLGRRILQVESACESGESIPAFQLHRNWLATRPGTVGLLVEYAQHALRPTVAYPYVLLLGLLFAQALRI